MNPAGRERKGARLPRLAIVGDPESRRVQGFQRALSELGGPPALVLSYFELLQQPQRLQQLEVDLVRVESPGENEQLSRELIAQGGGPLAPELEFGEVAYLAEYHRGYLQVLRWIEESGLPCLNAPSEIALMFDKWRCHQHLIGHGLSRPEAELAPTTYEALSARFEAPHGRLFLKPLHASSASGVCALRWSGKRVQMISSLELAGDRLFNSLRLRRYESWATVRALLSPLLPSGMIAERWIPKLSTPAGVVDLRVLVIDGKARHRVARQSRSPLTNLHLGNKRGDLDELRALLGAARWGRALDLAERAAHCFPNCLYAGVDVLLDTQKEAYIGEVNAFGDLLPNLWHQGVDVYQAIAGCLAKGWPRRDSERPS